jgi:hypothetical protein
MAIDLVPLHPGLTEGIRALYGETSCLSTRCPPEEVHGWVQESIRRREEEYSYAILRDTGLVGLCSLRGITSEPRTARLAYLIGRRHWQSRLCHAGHGHAHRLWLPLPDARLDLLELPSRQRGGAAGARKARVPVYPHEGPMPDLGPGQSERLLHFEFSRRQWEARTTQ